MGEGDAKNNLHRNHYMVGHNDIIGHKNRHAPLQVICRRAHLVSRSHNGPL